MSRRPLLRAACTLPATLVLMLASAVPVTAADDTDGDGVPDSGDCAPNDPAIRPGIPDRPDLAFVDANCDGIDGDVATSVFVTLGGNDAATGTVAQPMRTIQAAVAKAAGAGKDVYVAGGDYNESVALADNVGIFGGYAPNGSRSTLELTRITGAPAVLGVGDQGVVLQLLTLRGNPDGAGNSYAIRAVPEGADPSRLAVEGVTATAAAAGAPINGLSGAAGGLGVGFSGGLGGTAGCPVPGLGLLSVLNAPGAAGATAANNAAAPLTDAPEWSRAVAGPGANGGFGGGGQGGRGGTGGFDVFGFVGCGGQGGVGGTGGGGGIAGSGGRNGAGSFGAYLYNSTLTSIGSALVSAPGGTGGDGGSGGLGGSGGSGGIGAFGTCSPFGFCGAQGLPGNPGFAGGRGGGGGAGAGGPSTGVFQAGPQSSYADLGSTETAATGGLGGFAGNGGLVRAASGQSAPVLRSATAPVTATSDFDADGVLDVNDACATTPRGPTDANGDGCPDAPTRPAPPAPDTVITGGPAEGSIALTRSASIGFASSLPGSSFTCRLDTRAAAACASPLALTKLASGTHHLAVAALSSARVADPTPATRSWTVPRNNTELKHVRGWTKKTGSGYFDKTFSQATKKGSTLSAKVVGATRIALVATRAKGFGTVKVFLGKTLLKKVSLASTKTRKMQLIDVKLFSAPKSGTLTIVVATSGKLVRVEGLAVVTR